MAKRLSLPALRQRVLLRLNPKNTVPVNDCYRRLYTMSAGKVRRFGRTFPLNRCYSQLESVFSGKVFFALNIREALPHSTCFPSVTESQRLFPSVLCQQKNRDCVCSLFLWRWAVQDATHILSLGKTVFCGTKEDWLQAKEGDPA